ncbi:hypothetical protein AN1V17_03600 [Vallitalea sediminicola]
MTIEEVKKIILVEQLINYNWFGDHDIYPNEVCIRKVNDDWSVFTSDERCSQISDVLYQNESEALQDFLQRLRADKVLRSL